MPLSRKPGVDQRARQPLEWADPPQLDGSKLRSEGSAYSERYNQELGKWWDTIWRQLQNVDQASRDTLSDLLARVKALEAVSAPIPPAATWDTLTGKPECFPPCLPIDASDVENLPEPDFTIPATGVVPGTYGDDTNVASFTVGADGRLTFAGNVAITFPTVTTIYNGDGALTSGRTVTMNDKYLTFIRGTNDWTVQDGTHILFIARPTGFTSIGSHLPSGLPYLGVNPYTGDWVASGPTIMRLRSPSVEGATATAGQVFTLLDATTGEADFANPVGPGGSDTEVQLNRGGVFDGSPNVTIVGTGADDVLTLLKNADITNQKSAGLTGEAPTLFKTGGPNTKGIRVQGTPITGTTPPLDTADHAFELDEASGTRVDSIGSDDLSPTNAPGSTTGIINDALALNGTTQYVSGPVGSGNYDKITLEFWGNRSNSASDTLVAGWSDGGLTNSFYILAFAGGSTYVVCENGVSAVYFVADTTTGWTQYVMVYDGNGATDADKVKLYINGALQTLTFAAGPFPATYTITNDFHIGYDAVNNLYGNSPHDATRIWLGEALDQTDVDALYNSGAGLELTVSGTDQAANLAEFGPDGSTTNFVIDANGNTVWSDGINLVFGTSAGTMIATSAAEMFAFHGATPVVQDTGWTVSNYSTSRTLDRSSFTLNDLGDAFCTLVEKLILKGLIGA